jgi:hypothetical protein
MPLSLNGKPTFGAGRVFMTANLANPTPARALVPQSQSVDFKRKVESLFGERQLAVAVGSGQMEVTGKVEYSASQARIISDILFGVSGASGSYAEADKESGTVAATTPFIITVSNSATWLFDLGVFNAVSGAIYARVASGSEVVGKSYSVAAGVYTFAAGDEGVNMLISYAYTVTASGEQVTLSNELQGQTGAFQAVHVLPWGAAQDMFVFYNCTASSGGLSAKQSGFVNSMLEYTASTNSNDELGVASFAEAA